MAVAPPAASEARRARMAPAEVRRSSTSAGIFLVVAALNVVGLVMILSASSVLSIRGHGSAWYFVAKQALWASVGLVGLLVASRVDHRKLRRLAVPAMGATVGLLLLVMVPGVGTTVSGSTRWITLGPANLQPSELGKLALGLFCADLLARRQARLADWRAGLLPVAAATVLLVGLVMKQPDMGTSVCIVLVAAGCTFASGIPGRHLLASGAVVVAAGGLAGWIEPYRRDRLLSFRQPFEQYSGDGYQLAQSLMGLGSGGPRGVGFGQSRVKWGFLPNAHTDFIFAVIGEEGGLAGTLFVVGLFVALAWLGVRAALRAPDRFGSLLAAGITTWLVGQALVNICTVVGLAPVTGVPMPFVSFGGSALVISMVAVGILVNIARTGESGEQAPAAPAGHPRPPGALIVPLAPRRPRSAPRR
ncbi:MAG: putative lipid II flippase FtsW [Acidimicrobiales bacterium]